MTTSSPNRRTFHRTETFELTIAGLLTKRADLLGEAVQLRDRTAEINNDIAALGALIDFVKTNQEAILTVIVVIVIIGAVILVVGRIQRAHRRRAEAEEARQALEAERAREQARRQYLLARYNDEQIVNGIMGRRVWQGMSREQLIESWGQLHDIKEELKKTMRKEEFKYNRIGTDQYLSRVYLTNDTVASRKQ